ncbi:MAG: hypothetical protein E4H13_09900 [Calditrichales bacterium]|nr:MAG: hypothetical protein E4H13_09900 [Calditrichales bacterium]
MEKKINQVSIWNSFDNLVEQAENKFYAHDFDAANNLWEEYAHITGAANWKQSSVDLKKLTGDFVFSDITEPQQIFQMWKELRRAMHANLITSYAYHTMQRLYARTFLASKETVSFDLATGVFCFIETRYEKAMENFNVVLKKEPENMLARIFLSKSYYMVGQEEKGMALLSQAIFLNGEEILPEDIVAHEVQNLYGRLRSIHGKNEVSVWLAPFEAWYRNWLIFKEDQAFFQVMQQKERNERILQVKYYASEKYRHFIRCLYIAEYVRHFLSKEKGIIWEQEAYMEKLDANLFQRYRKKRKPNL